MVSFQTKNPNLGKFWRALDWKMLIYLRTIWNFLRIFGIFYAHLVHSVFIGTFFTVLVSCTWKNLATLATSSSTQTGWNWKEKNKTEIFFFAAELANRRQSSVPKKSGANPTKAF
jgi:hypothetical protein